MCVSRLLHPNHPCNSTLLSLNGDFLVLNFSTYYTKQIPTRHLSIYNNIDLMVCTILLLLSPSFISCLTQVGVIGIQWRIVDCRTRKPVDGSAPAPAKSSSVPPDNRCVVWICTTSPLYIISFCVMRCPNLQWIPSLSLAVFCYLINFQESQNSWIFQRLLWEQLRKVAHYECLSMGRKTITTCADKKIRPEL